jgi:hypothetical protein
VSSVESRIRKGEHASLTDDSEAGSASVDLVMAPAQAQLTPLINISRIKSPIDRVTLLPIYSQ